MKHVFRLPSCAILMLLGASLSAAQTQDATPPPPKSAPVSPPAALKPIHTPIVPEPDDAVRKGVEGKVTLRIVVDAGGNVTESEALSGPPELYGAAIASTKKWLFEPPGSAPVIRTAEVFYFFPRECPGPISDQGEVSGGGRSTSKNGNVITLDDNSDDPLPSYPEKERKAGIAGVMMLSVSVDRDGKVTEAHIVKSLSPALDKNAIEAVLTWRFKIVSSKGGRFPDQFEIPISFKPLCNPTF
jgi:TonB family protein